MYYFIPTAFSRCKKCLNVLACLLAFTFIFSLGLATVATAASNLPAGFIAISESPMSWDDAKSFCQQREEDCRLSAAVGA